MVKYYNLARSGSAPLMFLNCKGYVKQSQNDCSTYSPNGKPTYANRYDVKSDSFRHIDSSHNYTNSTQDYDNMASTITVDLFAQQMKYLHDNGFRVLLLNQLGYDPNNNVFDIKNVPLSTLPI